MKSTDARGPTHEQLTDMGKRAVAAIQRGESPDEVARVFGVNRSSVYGWRSRYRAGGWDALDAGKRGGRRPKLDAKAMQWVYESVVGTDPRQYRFEFALWTSRMVAELMSSDTRVYAIRRHPVLRSCRIQESFFIPSVSQGHGLLDIPEPVASALDVDHRAVMQQPIEDDGGEHLVAGEQFHSELESDLDLKRLPSGRFDTNDLTLPLGAFTYNILRWIGVAGLTGKASPVRHPAKRRRIRTVMQELMYLAARLVSSARRYALRFSRHCPGLRAFELLYHRLAYG